MFFCKEFDLIAANTFFQPSAKDARSTGSATYCPQKEYIQPAHKPYQSDLPPAMIDYILTPRRFRSAVTDCKVDWTYSRHERGVIYDHGTVIMKWNVKLMAPPKRAP